MGPTASSAGRPTPDGSLASRSSTRSDQDIVALYLPYPLPVDIRLDRDGYRISAWDRHERAPLVVDTSTDGAATRLSQLFSSSDQLVIGGRTV